MEQVTENNLCCLCNISLTDKSNYKLQCGHDFHTGCIIDWFRFQSSQCPSCYNNAQVYNNSTISNDQSVIINYLNYVDNQIYIAEKTHIYPSFRFASNEARKKNAPPQLKRLYASYKRMLANDKKQKVEFDNYKETELKEYRIINKKYRKIYIGHLRRLRRIRCMKRRICRFFKVET